MQWVFGAIEELAPVVLFFVAQSIYDFNTGVAVMLLATALILLIARTLKRSVPKFALASTIGVFAFALPSLLTGNASYFQLSDTILDGFFALLLLGSVLTGQPLLKPLFERIFAITDEAWRILTIRWGLLFFALAIANEFVRLNYSTDVWSLFKLLSTIGLLLFGCYQFTLSARMRITSESNAWGLRQRDFLRNREQE